MDDDHNDLLGRECGLEILRELIYVLIPIYNIKGQHLQQNT